MSILNSQKNLTYANSLFKIFLFFTNLLTPKPLAVDLTLKSKFDWLKEQSET